MCLRSCYSAFLSSFLLLVLALPVQAQQITFTHGPIPEGWNDPGPLGARDNATSHSLRGEQVEFLYAYPPLYDEQFRAYHNAFIIMTVFETGYDNLLERMEAGDSFRGWTNDTMGGWNLDRRRETNPGMTFRLVNDQTTHTTLDGHPTVLHRREWTASHNALPDASSYTRHTRFMVYWVDLGTTGVGIVVKLEKDHLQDTTLDQMAQAADAFISTFRFGQSAAGSADEGIPWEIVIGAGAIAAILTTIARKLRKKSNAAHNKPPAPSHTKKQAKKEADEPVGYILQLSHDRLTLQPDQPAPFTATAWRVDAKGGYHPAPEAQLRITVPPTMAEVVRVAPAEAKGQLACQITLVQEVSLEATPLTVTAQAPKGGTTAQVLVEAEPMYVIEFF